MWSKLIIMLCFCFLITGVSSCPKPKQGIGIANKGKSLVNQGEKKIIFFTYDQSSISEVSADILLDIVAILQDNPDAGVTLTGHTDNRGSHEYNLALGAKRADSAKGFIVGCTPYLEKRIRTASKGETEPLVIVQDDSKGSKYEKSHSKNRRVEISFSGMKK